MRTKAILTVMGMVFCMAQGHAQSDFSKDFNSFRSQVHKDFEDFRSQANANYAEFLRNAWKEFESMPAVPKPKDEERPPVVIKEDERKRPIEDKPVIHLEEIVLPVPQPQPQPLSPIKPVPISPIPHTEPVEDNPIEEPVQPKQDEKEVVKPVAQTMRFALYGTEMAVRRAENLRFSMPDVSPKTVSETWERLSSSEYNNLIIDCLDLRSKHRLCDWYYLRMLDVMCSQLLGKGTNEAEMLKAYIFCQSGYQIRLATVGSRLCMLYASEYHIFDKPYWNIDGTAFYADAADIDKISVCAASFQGEQALSLAIREEQRLDSKPSSTRIWKSNVVDWMSAAVSVDENLMAFCEGYPSSYYGDNFITRWALYANTPMSKAVREELYPQLQKMMTDKSLPACVEILNSWIQTAFVYEYDNKVWGHDRAFFSEETLYYPYCDCEDRSILLTRLVRDLLGLKCALVYYPGHLATAIAIGEEVKGDYIRIGGTKFLICDPTYIGASIGMTMQDMNNETAKVIVLE